MTEEFDQYADEYKDIVNKSVQFTGRDVDYFSEYKIKQLSRFIDSVALDTFELKLLDFGCGTGLNTSFMRAYFPDASIYCTDVSEKSLKVLEKRGIQNINILAYSELFSMNEEKFDLIFVSNVLHHIPFEDHQTVLKSLHKLLKTNSWIFILEHNPLNPLTRKFFENCPLDKDAQMLLPSYTKKLMLESSFKDILCRYIVFVPPRFTMLLHLEKFFSRVPFGAQYYIAAKSQRFFPVKR